MLQYDPTDTPLFDVDDSLPTEAEMFIFTVMLMLVKNFPYSSLEDIELRLDGASVERVAICIERQLSNFTRDVGHGERLRRRIRAFVNMRVASMSRSRDLKCRGST